MRNVVHPLQGKHVWASQAQVDKVTGHVPTRAALASAPPVQLHAVSVVAWVVSAAWCLVWGCAFAVSRVVAPRLHYYIAPVHAPAVLLIACAVAAVVPLPRGAEQGRLVAPHLTTWPELNETRDGEAPHRPLAGFLSARAPLRGSRDCVSSLVAINARAARSTVSQPTNHGWFETEAPQVS